MTRRPDIDVAAIKARITLEEVIRNHGVELKRSGKELVASCPFHDEKTPSFKVTPSKQMYYCPGCDSGGDSIRFVMQYRSIGFVDAANVVAEMAGGMLATSDAEPQKRASRRADDEPPKWIKTVAPNNAPAPPKSLRVIRGDQWTNAPAVNQWPYRNRAGELVGYACRIEFNREDGTVAKDVIPLSWQTDTTTGESKWRQGAFAEPRPLYGAELLDQFPEHDIVLVEGEKAADAGRRLVADREVLVLTWPGGCKAVDKADWPVLAGRRVTGWPDTDSQRDKRTDELRPYLEQPGMIAMLRIAEILAAHDVEMTIAPIDRPGIEADGWDAADAESEGWDSDTVMRFIGAGVTAAALREAEEHRTTDSAPDDDAGPPPATDFGPPPVAGDDHLAGDAPAASEPPKRKRKADSTPPDPDAVKFDQRSPVRPLGYNQGRYYYLSGNQRQVHEYAKHDHSTNGLLQLAPLAYWSDTFAGGQNMKSEGWQAATDALMRKCERAGIFDTDIIRGRGCWMDSDRMVINLGNRLVVGGESMRVDEIDSPMIYEAGPKLAGPNGTPLSTIEAGLVIEIAKRFNWEMPGSAALLAGWVVLAPLCGALRWRPHIWLTGGTGTGKTTILSDFIAPLLAGMELQVQGNSTEAGIRQRLRADARPVIFDESEQNDEKEEARIQNVLALVRQSSSETEARTLKGTTSGRHLEFHVRSMFCLASIQVGIKRQADHTRMSVLGLFGNSQVPAEELDAHQAKWLETEIMLAQLRDQPDFGARLMARSVGMLDVIRQNMKTMIRVAATHFRSQRLGDQYGTLLAGTAALFYDHPISEQGARKLIETFDWSTYIEGARDDESNQALSGIMQVEVRLEFENGTATATVGELVAAVAGGTYNADRPWGLRVAVPALGRLGIKVEPPALGKEGYVLICNKNDRLTRALRGKPWAEDWRSYLKRVRGAKSSQKSYRFTDGQVGRATMVPIDAALPQGD